MDSLNISRLSRRLLINHQFYVQTGLRFSSFSAASLKYQQTEIIAKKNFVRRSLKYRLYLQSQEWMGIIVRIN
ncbi:hypothetical protein BLOT_011552 [Blomia tropicalis]|nr:hypothetical protein BLOT_011552 [Blomia tropicalis]